MSPILVRPVREQLEHDRLIRFLQTRYKRKFDVAVNIGDEQTTPVKIGTTSLFPDLVLSAGKKLAAVIEVETGESVNNLEAMAQWVHFGRGRVAFYLYVPVQAYDVARRLCDANQVTVTEVWTYRPAIEGFDLVRMFHDASAIAPARARAAAPAAKAKRPARKARPAARSGGRSVARAMKKTRPGKVARTRRR